MPTAITQDAYSHSLFNSSKFVAIRRSPHTLHAGLEHSLMVSACVTRVDQILDSLPYRLPSMSSMVDLSLNPRVTLPSDLGSCLLLPATGGAVLWKVWALMFRVSDNERRYKIPRTGPPVQLWNKCHGRTSSSLKYPLLSITLTNYQQRTLAFGKLGIHSKKHH